MEGDTMASGTNNHTVRSFLRIVRESLSGVQHDYTSGPLRRAVFLLAIPMILEMVMESIFAVVDIFFVARLGPDAVATVGLTESLLTLLYAVAIGLSMAATATVARRIGEKDEKAAARAGMQAIWLGIGIAAVIGIPSLFLAPRYLELMGASTSVIEEGSGYTRILLGANVVIMLLFLNNAVFRGAGDATIAMRSLWLANGINVVLDPCLIFGLGPFPELGVTGAAIATTIGRGTGVLYQVVAFRSQKSRIRLEGDALLLRPKILFRLIRVSLGGIGQFLIATASWVALMRIVSQYGSAATAGYTIAVRIVIFALLPSWGLANAAATLVGQNLGAERPDRAERSVWMTGRYNMYFLLGVTALFVTFAPWIVAIFTDDPDVVPIAVASLRIISYGYIFYAWGMVFTNAFNGAGDTVTPTWLNAICFWALQIPMAWILANEAGWGPNGVFWSVAIAESILTVMAGLVFSRGRWKQTAV
jgi:putative MATE family efflux protein